MVKLSYVNRPIEGLQAGQAIAKALLKRVPGGPGYKTALRDPHVELDASGKQLGKQIPKQNPDDVEDWDGFSEVAAALTSALRCGEQVVVLEELCLRGNQLRPASLEALAEIVRLAAGDLRDLDLSDNELFIESETDALAWEHLLSSFSRCFVLRRLDLSGNSLGPKGFEILAKMYGREAPLELSLHSALAKDEDIVQSQSEEEDLVMMESTKPATLRTRAASNVRELALETSAQKTPTKAVFQSAKAVRQDAESPRKENLSPSKTSQFAAHEDIESFSATSGLRSVPYIVLANTNMNDACALYLSYILACHYPRNQLMAGVPKPKAGPPLQQLEHYDLSCKDCEGIIYLPNGSLTSAGIKVLKVAERVRREAYPDTSQQGPRSGPQSPLQPHRRISDAPTTPHFPKSNGHQRVSSASRSSDHSSPPQASPSTTSDIHQARSRIQGDILRDRGPRANELWYCSIKMLSLARTIILKHSTYLRNQLPEHPDTLTLSQLNLAVLNLGAGRDAPPSPLSPGQATPVIIPSLHRRRPRTDSTAIHSLTMTPLALAPPNSASSRQEPRSGVKPLPTRGGYRSQLFGGLNKALWGRILGLVADPRDVVSESQRLRIVSWGWDRGTLEREREFLGKVQAQQIWRVLEDLECLEYESRV